MALAKGDSSPILTVADLAPGDMSSCSPRQILCCSLGCRIVSYFRCVYMYSRVDFFWVNFRASDVTRCGLSFLALTSFADYLTQDVVDVDTNDDEIVIG